MFNFWVKISWYKADDGSIFPRKKLSVVLKS